MIKSFIAIVLFSASISHAQVTAHKFVVDSISNLHDGDEVMEVMNGGSDFVGYKIPFGKGLLNFFDSISQDNMNDFYFQASHNFFGKYDDDYKKNPHFKNAKVKRIVAKLMRKCKRFAAQLNKETTISEEYYCSKIFVYTGDIEDPELEGPDLHTATGQLNFKNQKQAPGTKSPSQVRQSLDSNNELMGNYEVYTIGLMRK